MENYADMMFQGAVADLQRTQGSYDKFQSFYVYRTQSELSEQDIAFIHALTIISWPTCQ